MTRSISLAGRAARPKTLHNYVLARGSASRSAIQIIHQLPVSKSGSSGHSTSSILQKQSLGCPQSSDYARIGGQRGK